MLDDADILTPMSERERLGNAIATRRQHLGLSIAAAAELAGINRATWSTAETGTRLPQPYNRAGIERALRWAVGSIDAILAGDEPTELSAGGAVRGGREPSFEEALAHLRQATGLTPQERRAALRELIDLYGEPPSGHSAAG